ncbi:hypothetical protein LCGC14_0273940 [marine sediment metagenome]|uniref:Uncharacterized protein n=2 Tax=root TaxID=1 RepID=A0A9C9TIG7_9HYPH|nr:hypothetical protein [Aurantimonas coralicida]
MTSDIYEVDRAGYGAAAFGDGLPLALFKVPVRDPVSVGAAIMADFFDLDLGDREALADGRTAITMAGRKVDRLGRELASIILASRESFTWTAQELSSFIDGSPRGWEHGDLVWFPTGNGWEAGSIEAVTRRASGIVIDAIGSEDDGEPIKASVSVSKLRHRDKAKQGRDRPEKVKP